MGQKRFKINRIKRVGRLKAGAREWVRLGQLNGNYPFLRVRGALNFFLIFGGSGSQGAKRRESSKTGSRPEPEDGMHFIIDASLEGRGRVRKKLIL